MDELYTKRYPFSYKFDIGYTYVKYFPRSGNKLTLRLGIHNILGNPIKEEISNFYKVNAERKSKVDDNTAKMQSIKWLGV